MRSNRDGWAFWTRIVIILALVLLHSCISFAEDGNESGGQVSPLMHKTLRLEPGESYLYQIADETKTISRVSVDIPEVADIVPVSNVEAIIIAKKEGSATIRIWNSNNDRVTYNLQVVKKSVNPDSLKKALESEIANSNLSIQLIGESVLVSGEVDSDQEIKRITAVCEGRGLKFINLLKVKRIAADEVVNSLKTVLQDDRLTIESLPDYTIMIRGTVATHEEAIRIQDIVQAWTGNGETGTGNSLSSNTQITIGENQQQSPDVVDKATVDARQIKPGQITVGEEISIARSVFSGQVKNGPRIVAVLEINSAVAKQILVSVQVLEVDRNKLKAHGFEWGSLINNAFAGQPFFLVEDRTPAQGHSTTVVPLNDAGPIRRLPLGAQVRALVEDNSAKILSEPQLLISDGHAANIHVGGELPVPTAQSTSLSSTSVSVTFKPFGIQLTVKPKITPDNRVVMTVSPEVSDLDFTNAVRASGFVIPSVTVRRATTTVYVDSGQSLAIGGLFSSKSVKVLTEVPLLGKIPIIGELFKSREFREDQTELVILVTPRILDKDEASPITVLSEGISG